MADHKRVLFLRHGGAGIIPVVADPHCEPAKAKKEKEAKKHDH